MVSLNCWTRELRKSAQANLLTVKMALIVHTDPASHTPKYLKFDDVVYENTLVSKSTSSGIYLEFPGLAIRNEYACGNTSPKSWNLAKDL